MNLLTNEMQEYLLLGGLEPKYRTMHEKTVAAVKKWLLYRPMTPDGADILFSAKLTTSGHPDVDANRQFEVPHLTCFLGGMFALGAKVFGLDADMEVARRLTDGCVWAYGATPSGIMPEGSTMVPCKDPSGCAWNETLWWQFLDPQWQYRDKQIEDYYANKEEIEAHLRMVQAQEEAERLREQAGEGEGGSSNAGIATQDGTQREKTLFELEGVAGKGAGAAPAAPAPATPGPEYPYPRPEPVNDAPAVAKREVDPGWDYRKSAPVASEIPSADDVAAERAGGSEGTPTKTTTESPDFNPESSYSVPGRNAVGGEFEQIPLEDPNKPLTHEQYVKSRIENEKIPRGFVRISSRRYILR